MNVEKVISHEKYNKHTVDYDIAVLKLAETLNFTKSVQPIALPELNETIPDGTKCLVSGWGVSKGVIQSMSHELRAVRLSIMNHATCQANYRRKRYDITDRMICAGNKKGGKDSCYGDSGGPLACKHFANDDIKLFGIVSWGRGCGKKGYPGVNSRVAALRKWIHDNTGV